MLQIYTRNFHNDLILPVTQGGFYGVQDDEGRLFIGDISLMRHRQKHTNKNNNINNIACGRETCISAILIQ